MKTQTIQVCGILELSDAVVGHVADEDATGYGVYVGNPGDFRWLRDFKTKAEALFYANLVAGSNPHCAVSDETYSEARL